MFLQHAPGKWIYLAEGYGLETASSLKAQTEAADA